MRSGTWAGNVAEMEVKQEQSMMLAPNGMSASMTVHQPMGSVGILLLKGLMISLPDQDRAWTMFVSSHTARRLYVLRHANPENRRKATCQ